MYLTPELKSYYLKELEAVEQLPEGDFWALDNGTHKALAAINAHSDYQTIYSKRFAYPSDGTLPLFYNSYIDIAFSERAQLELQNTLDRIASEFHPQSRSVKLLHPETNSIDEHSDIGCRANPDYFRIFSFPNRNRIS